MLLIKTKLKESKIHGIGLFADEFIVKGTLIWKFQKGFDMEFSKEEIANLPDFTKIYLAKYAWRGLKTGVYCLSTDNAKHFNHSQNNNTKLEYSETEVEGVVYTIKDIQIGEELTENYDDFENIHDPENILVEVLHKFNLIDEMDPRLKPKDQVQ